MSRLTDFKAFDANLNPPLIPRTFDVAVVGASVYPRPLGPITHLFGPFLLGAEPTGEHVLAAPPGGVHKRSTAAPPMYP
jgi:hypothetical protein